MEGGEGFRERQPFEGKGSYSFRRDHSVEREWGRSNQLPLLKYSLEHFSSTPNPYLVFGITMG